jgi:hypothetical protein
MTTSHHKAKLVLQLQLSNTIAEGSDGTLGHYVGASICKLANTRIFQHFVPNASETSVSSFKERVIK